MPRFLSVLVDPLATSWVNLSSGYTVLNEILIDDSLIEVDDALPQDERLSYVDQNTGRIYRASKGDIVDGKANAIALLGYEDLSEFMSEHHFARIVFDWPQNGLSQQTKKFFADATRSNADYFQSIMQRNGGLDLPAEVIRSVLFAAMKSTTGRTGEVQVRNFFPYLRLANA